ncbi:hypothetical protein [Streptomyces sp. NBC_01601]|uniref:hypothetical protein n=1 Tax=Streptomyces sp. NBC_01601 TaxID=2975892 RepID=UPI002E2C0858|nr:hypothetical protein [Streptomyces sp. NBC_01601]
MTSSVIAPLRRTRSRSTDPTSAERSLAQQDTWRAIAFAVDRAAADLLPLSTVGTSDVAAGNRAIASLVGGRFLLERIYDRNTRYVKQAQTYRERYRRHREVANLRPYMKAFRKAIDYARTVADGQPASGRLPALFQPGTRLPLVQRFLQDRQVLVQDVR